MKSSNPFLTKQSKITAYESGEVFTSKGALNKTILGLVVMVAVILITMATPLINLVAVLYLPLSIGLIVALVALTIAVRNDVSKAKTVFWVYAICEALLLSVFIAVAESILPGVGVSAGIITFGIVLGMYFLYQVAPGLIRGLTPIFIVGIGVLGVLFAINLIASIFGGGFLPYDSAWFIIILLGFSSFSIALDFQQMDMMSKASLPREYEWLASLGLLASIIWTFVNVIRLLLIFGGRD